MQYLGVYNVAMQTIRHDIGDFIKSNIEAHPTDIVALTARAFGVSRQRVHTYVSRLIKEGHVIKIGNTRSSRYYSTTGKVIEFGEKIRPGLAEDRVWSQYLRPMLQRLPENVYRICNYGFTEIYNNAIDHSSGTFIFVKIEADDQNVVMTIVDNGIGIFKKIQNALHLDSIWESILHLAKGKFTTDPSKHSGEGIFFTSRIFDSFSIFSSNMLYSFENEDWLLSDEQIENFGDGTSIRMSIPIHSQRTTKEIMDKYADAETGFGKTIVAVRLSSDSDDPHVSRSQAKRLLMGLDRFRHVILDFKRVDVVGQAFIDEVFRVFHNEHPGIKIEYINASPDVEAMIARVRSTV